MNPPDPTTFSSYQLFMVFFVPLSTGIIVTLFGIIAARKAASYYEGWQKYNDLRDKTEAEFKTLVSAQYTCLKSSIETLKASKADRGELFKEAEEIRKQLEREANTLKVSLDKRAENIWDRVNNHEHSIECDSKDCTARQTSGVITNPHG